MERGSTLWRVVMVVGGALLAGAVSGVLESYGVRDVYALVVGISVAVPLMADGLNPDEVLTDLESRIRRAAATVLGAAVVGTFGAFALVLSGQTGGIAVGVAAGMAYVGGLLVRGLVSSGAESETEPEVGSI